MVTICPMPLTVVHFLGPAGPVPLEWKGMQTRIEEVKSLESLRVPEMGKAMGGSQHGGTVGLLSLLARGRPP